MLLSSKLLATAALHWSPCLMPGGGWMTFLSIGPDNTVLVGSDTTAPAILDPGATKLRQAVVMGVTVPNALRRNNGFTAGLDVFRGDSNYMAMHTMDAVLVSSDKGATFHSALSAPGAVTDHQRMLRKRLAFDPHDHNTLVLGMQTNTVAGSNFHVQYTTNAYATTPTWTRPTGTPTVGDQTYGNGAPIIAFNPASGVDGNGRTLEVAIMVAGYGVYRSTTTITGTFTLIAGSPKDFSKMVYTVGGRLLGLGHCIDEGGDATNVFYSDAGAAFTQSTGETGVAIAVHPTDATKVIIVGNGGRFSGSTDGGQTFSSGFSAGNSRSAPDAPWMEKTNEVYMSDGDIALDGNGWLYFSEGIGLWRCKTPSYTGGAITLTAVTRDYQNMIAQYCQITPRGTVIAAVQDRGFWSWKAGEEGLPSLNHGPGYNFGLQHAQNVDWAINNPTTLVGINIAATGNYFQGFLSKSLDEGRTWNPIPFPADFYDMSGVSPAGAPSLSHGQICVSNDNNFVVITPNGRPAFTLDGGTTWAKGDFGTAANAILDIAPGTKDGSGHDVPRQAPSMFSAYSLRRENLIADKEHPGTFYVCIPGDDNGTSAASGEWMTTNGGANWTRVTAGHIMQLNLDYYHAHWKCVPGFQGHLVCASGDVANNYDNPQPQLKMRYGRLSGGTMTWVDIPAPFGMVGGLDFGTNPNPLAKCMSFYAFAEDAGFWVCDNFDPDNPTSNAATWTKICDYPMGRPGNVVCVAADKRPGYARRVVLAIDPEGFVLGVGGSRMAA